MNDLLVRTLLLQRLINLELVNRKSISKINIKGLDTPEDIHCFYLDVMLKILALSVEMEKNLILLGATNEKGIEVGERPGGGTLPEMEEDVPQPVSGTPNRVSSY